MGASCTIIGSGACDHLSSQMTPVETFGNTFVTINMPNCKSPVNFKIVASENDTDVDIAGRDQVKLSKSGDKYLFRIVDQSSKVVSSSKPITVGFFRRGCGAPSGDPSMILLQPTQQFAADYTFTTIDYPGKPFNNALTINCTPSITVPGDIIDNDCDGLIDVELQDGIDNDGDGEIDEDLAKPLEEFNTTTTSTTSTTTTTPEHTTTTIERPTTLRLSTSTGLPPTTTPRHSTTPTRTTTSYIKDIIGDNLSTYMVIAGVLSSLFALSCLSTAVYLLKRKLKGKNGQVEDVFSSISSNNIPPVHTTVQNKA
ncbi:unnamed protein product [Mytilus edulis]|uniref:IgGFc-binding protein N-terminal domain-containing protein n=1 Tax=Mytilus edulis TaxID=6550 RepID=A0A8S3VCP1_MYTED|nr:unnamed protein product [Mytilus edulis]